MTVAHAQAPRRGDGCGHPFRSLTDVFVNGLGWMGYCSTGCGPRSIAISEGPLDAASLRLAGLAATSHAGGAR